MQKRLAVCNQKGGVAKSTTAVNLAVLFAKRGNKVLLVDYDPQGNASQFLGLIDRVAQKGVYTSVELTLGTKAFSPQRNVTVDGLDVVPATMALAGIEFTLLQDVKQGTHKLAQALSAVAQEYDFIVIDCPPTLGMLAIAALVAATNVLIPVQLLPASIPGALQLYETLDALRESSHPYLKVIGVLGTFLEETTKTPRVLFKQLREIFGEATVLKTAIHRASVIADSAGVGRPVVLTAPRSRATKEFNSLADEVLDRV